MAKTERKDRDPRAGTISTIWGCTIAIMGVCIPLTAIAHSGPLLPLLTLVGATVTSSIVWLSKRPEENNPELHHTIAQLEHRVAQLEIETRDIELRYAIENSSQKTQPPLA